jgi:hypothetical protein
LRILGVHLEQAGADAHDDDAALGLAAGTFER